MSSGVDSGGIVAAAVMLPAAVAFGAGWLAWQSGKLMVEANRVADKKVAEKRNQQEAAARQRKMAAFSGHDHLVKTCGQLLDELAHSGADTCVSSAAQLEKVKFELRKICAKPISDDVVLLERQNTLDYLKLDSILQMKKNLYTLKLTGTELYSGLSVADLMDDLRVAFSSVPISEVAGNNVAAADPRTLERRQLNKRLSEVTGQIIGALEFVESLTKGYGLNDANNAWFHSCFNGVEEQIKNLCSPTTSNPSLKKGVRRLEEMLQQFNMLRPSIEHDKNEFDALYPVYQQAAQALGEPVLDGRQFKSLEALKDQMRYLEERRDKAAQCAVLYQKLGHSAYMCFAWDEELKAMGYSVRTRKEISELVKARPNHAKLGDFSLPFYQWDQKSTTQFYSISPQCELQLIVHEDGAVSMQTMSSGSDTGQIRRDQEHHCQQMRALHENLRRNWFVLYDYQETAPAKQITRVAAWRMSSENIWRGAEEQLITEQRNRETSGTNQSVGRN